MNNIGQPSNKIISRKFVETTIIILFVITIIATIILFIAGIIFNTQDNISDNNNPLYYYISAISLFLGCCVFLSFLIVNILKVCELEKINDRLDSKEPKKGATELLTLLADMQTREVINQAEYDKEKQRILEKM